MTSPNACPVSKLSCFRPCQFLLRFPYPSVSHPDRPKGRSSPAEVVLIFRELDYVEIAIQACVICCLLVFSFVVYQPDTIQPVLPTIIAHAKDAPNLLYANLAFYVPYRQAAPPSWEVWGFASLNLDHLFPFSWHLAIGRWSLLS